MENESKLKCAHCQSEHVHVHKAGFGGLAAFLGFFAMLIVASVITQALTSDASGVGASISRLMSMGASTFEIYMIAATGVLLGTIGMNKIVISCMNCSKKSDPGKLKT